MTARRPRPAARILLVDAGGRVLLFRFTPADRSPFWCAPGGALDPGESYAAAARRELREEVGIDRDCGPEVAQRTAEFLTIEGVEVVADERYFRVEVDDCAIDTGGHTPLEQRVMTQWRWFAPGELAGWPEPIFPEDLASLLHLTALLRPELVEGHSTARMDHVPRQAQHERNLTVRGAEQS